MHFNRLYLFTSIQFTSLLAFQKWWDIGHLNAFKPFWFIFVLKCGANEQQKWEIVLWLKLSVLLRLFDAVPMFISDTVSPWELHWESTGFSVFLREGRVARLVEECCTSVDYNKNSLIGVFGSSEELKLRMEVQIQIESLQELSSFFLCNKVFLLVTWLANKSACNSSLAIRFEAYILYFSLCWIGNIFVKMACRIILLVFRENVFF